MGRGLSAGCFTENTDFGGGASYWLDLRVAPGLSVPVNAYLIAGPNAASFSLGSDGRDGLRGQVPLLSSPAVGDAYVVTVVYADGSAEALPAQVTGVVTGLATLVSPAAGATGVSTLPTFSWTLPATLPAPYRQTLLVQPASGGNWIWQYPAANGVTSATYDTDGSATQSALDGGSGYSWGIELQDAYGNASMRSAGFTTQ